MRTRVLLVVAVLSGLAAVAQYQDADEAPLETELLEMVHERVIRRVAEGGHLTQRDQGKQ